MSYHSTPFHTCVVLVMIPFLFINRKLILLDTTGLLDLLPHNQCLYYLRLFYTFRHYIFQTFFIHLVIAVNTKQKTLLWTSKTVKSKDGWWSWTERSSRLIRSWYNSISYYSLVITNVLSPNNRNWEYSFVSYLRFFQHLS